MQTSDSPATAGERGGMGAEELAAIQVRHDKSTKFFEGWNHSADYHVDRGKLLNHITFQDAELTRLRAENADYEKELERHSTDRVNQRKEVEALRAENERLWACVKAGDALRHQVILYKPYLAAFREARELALGIWDANRAGLEVE